MRSLLRLGTARWLAAAAAVAAVLTGIEMTRRQAAVCQTRMAHHASERRRLTANMEVLLRRADTDPTARAVLLFDADRHRRAVAWHSEREEANRLTAWRPWKPIESDRTGPPWPPIPLELSPASLPEATASDRTKAPIVDTFLFHPWRYPRGDWESKDPSFEDAWFRAADGVRLNGWFAEVQAPRAVVLYAEGNAGNITGRRWVIELFRNRLHASVLIFDYRGYGRSEGSPSIPGILMDARAAREWLAKRTGVTDRDMVLVGHSLGGAVAVDLASRDGARSGPGEYVLVARGRDRKPFRSPRRRTDFESSRFDVEDSRLPRPPPPDTRGRRCGHSLRIGTSSL